MQISMAPRRPPSLPLPRPLPSTPRDERVRTQRGARRGRRAAAVNAAEVGACMLHAYHPSRVPRTLNANHRPTDRKTDLVRYRPNFPPYFSPLFLFPIFPSRRIDRSYYHYRSVVIRCSFDFSSPLFFGKERQSKRQRRFVPCFLPIATHSDVGRRGGKERDGIEREGKRTMFDVSRDDGDSIRGGVERKGDRVILGQGGDEEVQGGGGGGRKKRKKEKHADDT